VAKRTRTGAGVGVAGMAVGSGGMAVGRITGGRTTGVEVGTYRVGVGVAAGVSVAPGVGVWPESRVEVSSRLQPSVESTTTVARRIHARRIPHSFRAGLPPRQRYPAGAPPTSRRPAGRHAPSRGFRLAQATRILSGIVALPATCGVLPVGGGQQAHPVDRGYSRRAMKSARSV